MQVVSAGATMFALKSDGTVWALGGNDTGQLGINETGSRGAAAAHVPVQVQQNADLLEDGGTPPAQFLTGVTQLSRYACTSSNELHDVHVCAVNPQGVWCWGANRDGELGQGARSAQIAAAALVPAPEGVTFTAVTAGGHHTCALSSTGDVYCWGASDHGQTGIVERDGGFAAPAVATQVAGITIAISASTSHKSSCAITSDGVGWCWGRNARGQRSASGPYTRRAVA